MNESQRLFARLSTLALARGLALLGGMMAVLFGFITWARGASGGVLSVLAAIASLLFAGVAVLGATAFVHALRDRNALAARLNRQGAWTLLLIGSRRKCGGAEATRSREDHLWSRQSRCDAGRVPARLPSPSMP